MSFWRDPPQRCEVSQEDCAALEEAAEGLRRAAELEIKARKLGGRLRAISEANHIVVNVRKVMA